MLKRTDFYIVESSVLPDIIKKTFEAKHYLESGQEITVQDAVNRAKISRSAFYKYRNAVFAFYENSRGKTVTFAINLDNQRGILSSVLNTISDYGANILTINQTIPINKIANVTISIETGEIGGDLSNLTETLAALPGVLSFKIIARE